MRILFVLNRLAWVRHFDRAVRLLADRGHDICLASQDDDVELHGLLKRHPRITAVAAPRHRTDDWAKAAAALRRTRDYLRYLHPRYASAQLLRERAFEKLAAGVAGRSEHIDATWSEFLLRMPKYQQKRLDGLLRKLETAIPTDARIDAFLAAQRPDAVIVSPLVAIGFTQADVVKSARTLGVPSGLLVFSWDNLSNKGLIHEMPDRVFVWNQTQQVEAVKLHRCPPERIVITGAPRFDPFFELKPATTREEFCGLVGLDPARPLITYLCSSKFVAAGEKAFVERWIRELRASTDRTLAGCALIIRPHPAGGRGWHAPSPAVVRGPGVLKWKASLSKPFADTQAVVMNSPLRNADIVLHDTVFHSAAVVGLNTSAEIEAAIVGRPVYTIIDPGAKGQQGTLHFHYLLQANGGHVERADGFDEHRAQLSRALAGEYDRAAGDRFLQTFVRPRGLTVPVAPIVASAIEDLAAGHAGTASTGQAVVSRA